MTDGHQKCVGKGVLDGVVKFGKYRVDVHEKHQVNHQDHHEDHQEYLAKGACCAAADADVNGKENCGSKHDQIDDDALLQILLKGFEKAAYNVGFFIAYHLHCDIEHGRNGRADCNNWDTADDAQNIQNDKICYSAHKGEKFVIHVEETIHSYTPLFCLL